jgi:hypothetical protein
MILETFHGMWQRKLTFTSALSLLISKMAQWFSDPHILQLWHFTLPDMWNVTSSLNYHFWNNFQYFWHMTKCIWQTGNNAVNSSAWKPIQYALCRHGVKGSSEQASKQPFHNQFCFTTSFLGTVPIPPPRKYGHHPRLLVQSPLPPWVQSTAPRWVQSPHSVRYSPYTAGGYNPHTRWVCGLYQ